MLSLPVLPKRVLAGVSGGADSVALLRLLIACREHRGTEVYAVHVNHGLRGEASDGDEAFVRALCDTHAVPLYCYRADLRSASEEAAREARYAFFREAYAESGADALVLAHHRDDQAETLLLHLLRGCGTSGLAGMAQESILQDMRIIRPLLSFSRQDLRDYLRSIDQPWREDASNTDNHYLRNALRNTVLPMLEELAPGCTGRIAETAAIVGREDALLRQQTEDFLQCFAGEDWIALQPLRQLPETMQTRVLRTFWQNCHPEVQEHSLSRRQTEELLLLLRKGRQGEACPLPLRESARLGWHALHLEPGKTPPDTNAYPAENGTTLMGCTFLAQPADASGQLLPVSCLQECVLRTTRDGDWIRPFGMQGTQTLQRYLANRHIDAQFRTRIPLLCRGNEVLMVCGVGAGNVPDEKTIHEESRRVRWEGRFPWTE